MSLLDIYLTEVAVPDEISDIDTDIKQCYRINMINRDNSRPAVILAPDFSEGDDIDEIAVLGDDELYICTYYDNLGDETHVFSSEGANLIKCHQGVCHQITNAHEGGFIVWQGLDDFIDRTDEAQISYRPVLTLLGLFGTLNQRIIRSELPGDTEIADDIYVKVFAALLEDELGIDDIVDIVYRLKNAIAVDEEQAVSDFAFHVIKCLNSEEFQKVYKQMQQRISDALTQHKKCFPAYTCDNTSKKEDEYEMQSEREHGKPITLLDTLENLCSNAASDLDAGDVLLWENVRLLLKYIEHAENLIKQDNTQYGLLPFWGV